ncbi:hypothetical protein FKW77_003530 [Venturia effusa]|uniref:Uncharacterized protein n=1 Tax=Venturia effusa TaxID=50376 RepID=A0A517LAR8_9PEZI|nr:hypothetical protein FKW77_003530 [Venturia effusa]
MSSRTFYGAVAPTVTAAQRAEIEIEAEQKGEQKHELAPSASFSTMPAELRLKVIHHMAGFDEEYLKNHGKLLFSRAEGRANGEVLYRTNLPFIGLTVERLWGVPTKSSTHVSFVGKAVTISDASLFSDGFDGNVASVAGNDAFVVTHANFKTIQVPTSALRLPAFGIQQSAPAAIRFSQEAYHEKISAYVRARCLAITHSQQVPIIFAYLRERNLGLEVRRIIFENVLESRSYTNMRNDISVRPLSHWATGTNRRDHFDIITLCPTLEQVTVMIDYSMFWSIDAKGAATLDTITAIFFKLSFHMFLTRGNIRKLCVDGLNYNQTRRDYPAEARLFGRAALENIRDGLEVQLIQHNVFNIEIEYNV